MAFSSSEITNIAGTQLPEGACVVIVRTQWNKHVVDLLEEGCIKLLNEKQVQVKIIEVPGAIEIPFAIKNYWENHQYKCDKPHAFIALGCVIQGGTPHFEYVCQSVTEAITQLNILLPVPTIFGVLTLNSQAQADERTGGIHGHKGEEAAATAIKMMALVQSFKNG